MDNLSSHRQPLDVVAAAHSGGSPVGFLWLCRITPVQAAASDLAVQARLAVGSCRSCDHEHARTCAPDRHSNVDRHRNMLTGWSGSSPAREEEG